MSELGLRFEESAPGRSGRHRHRAQSKQRKQKRRGGKSFVALLIAVLLLGGLGYGGWWGINWVQGALSTPDYTGAGVGAVTVEVTPGQTLAEIAQTLFEADVVASPQAFVEAARANPDSVNIQPGFYELPQQLPGARALELLLDTGNRLVDQVTIPEGLSIFRTFDVLSEALEIPVEEFEEAAQDPVALGIPEFWFNRTDEQDAAESLEGFLFPSTYEFPPDPSAEQVLEIMIGQFLTVVENLGFVDTVESERNIAPYEALIVASLSQAEAGVADDLPRITRVAYNRVYQAQMPLQFDVTTNYWLEVQGEDPRHSGELSQEELNDPDNPYNTGDGSLGLPLGPINSPGQEALQAAMEPAEGDWLYFVAIDQEGNSAFAITFDEHCQNVNQAIEAGVPLDPCG